MYRLWWPLVLWHRLLGLDSRWTSWVKYRGFRRVLGGHWGLWEVKLSIGEPFLIWVASPCEHHPRVPLSVCAEPLEVEDWG